MSAQSTKRAAKRSRRKGTTEREGEREKAAKTRQTKRQFRVTHTPLCPSYALCNPQRFFFLCVFPTLFLAPTRDICINYHLFNMKKRRYLEMEMESTLNAVTLSLSLSLPLSAGKLVIKGKCIK